MWSKQADTRNKNMTSFKNKISNRKRKNAKSGQKNGDEEPTKPVENNKNNRNKGRERLKSDDKTEVPKAAKCDKDDITKNNSIEKDLEATDVVLRNASNLDKSKNSLKRYSDSYVLETKSNSILENVPAQEVVVPKIGLTRAVSGFIYLESRKSRFSEFFKSGAMKLSASTENLKSTDKKATTDNQNDATKKQSKQSSKNTSNKNKPNKTEVTSTTSVSRNNSQRLTGKKETPAVSTTETSYLKRVKSRIYKSKSDDTAPPNKLIVPDAKSKKLKPKKGMEITGRIPEDEEAIISPPGVRKSLTHFDFRLMRQSSNLERKRSIIQEDKVDTSSSVPPSPKPLHFFGKAKSSSAINLNLLRNRKNKVLDNSCTDVQSEFDFIAFGSVNSLQRQRLFGSQTAINNNKTPSWLHYSNGRSSIGAIDVLDGTGDSNRTGQPVSRSGSDRRPDAVREERHQQEAAGAVDPMNDSLIADSITPDSGERIPPTKRKSTNVNRSESVKEQSEKRKQQRRNISDPSHNNTPSADVDIDTPQSGLSNPDSSSSSNCSLSNGRLSDSPSNSVDTVQGRHHQHNKTDSDSESGFESDIPMWQNLVPEDQRKNLTPQEQKRQDIINELFSTENSHVRSLRVLYKIFYERLKNSQQLKPDEMSLIFPNIKDLFEVHNDFNKRMKKRRNEQPLIREVGDIVLHMFDSDLGLELKKAAAKFCEKQHIALQMIQDRRKKDSKFNDLLTECEKKRHCRRLPFQGFLPAEMQRLSKYPLLLERLLGNVEDKSNEETAKLQRALQKSREILNFVNESIREASNRHRLEEIQKHLDITNFKGDHPILRDAPSITDVTSHKLIREGSMLLKRPNKGPVPVHILLMEEAVYILQKEGDRFLLKFFQSGSVSNTLPLSPYIKTSLLLVRNNAVCKNGLYLVNTHTNNSQIYDLVAEDDTQRDLWLKHFEKAVENHCKKDGKMKNTPASDLDTEEIVQDLHTNDVQPERAEQVEQEADKEDEGHEKTDEDKPVNDGENHERDTTKSPETVSGGGNGILRTSKITAEEWPLIQPSQVQVEVPPVHTAESMLTPLEQIKRKDNIVMQALEDKQSLIADLLNIPREDFAHIADMASTENTSTREPSDRVMAAIYQTNQLLQLLNESLNISESDAVIARGGKSPACASQKDLASNNALKPSVPVDAVQNLVQPLSRQLNALLDEVKQMEDERDRLRRETAKMRERLHEQYNLHGPEPAEAISSEETGEDLGSTQESLRKPEDSETAE